MTIHEHVLVNAGIDETKRCIVEVVLEKLVFFGEDQVYCINVLLNLQSLKQRVLLFLIKLLRLLDEPVLKVLDIDRFHCLLPLISALRHQFDKRPQNVHVFAWLLCEEILSILLNELKTVLDADLEQLLALWRLGKLTIECSLNYIEDCFRFSRHFQGWAIEALHLRAHLQGLESSVAVRRGLLLLLGLLRSTFLFSFDTQQIVPLLRLHSLIPLNLTFNILETLQNLRRQFASIMPELH
jgi:hypothetical protein